MNEHLKRIVQTSLGATPEEMLKISLDSCIELAGATGGSLLGEEGPYLQFLFSNVPELIGVRVPFDSIAGACVDRGLAIYTYAPSDKRHFDGVDRQLHQETKYLLSIPIPSVQRASDEKRKGRNPGALQLLFAGNVIPELDVSAGAHEMPIEEFQKLEHCEKRLGDVFTLLPIIAFGIEVMKLRQTSYQAIHELKNKLISGHSWVNNLREDITQIAPAAVEDQAVAEDFQIAESSLREGAELAKTYLQFTKLYSPVFQPVNINDVLKETGASVQALAGSMGADSFEVVFEPDPAVPVRSLDPGQLKMAFFNLCKNAVEALVEHKVTAPRITISSRAGENRITIVIRDNGPGMPRIIADNLFIPFKTKKEGGTGLGLTITKKIVDGHGGTIRCETGGDGTSFTITI